MIQTATRTSRTPKLIMLNEAAKKGYIEHIMLTQAAERAEERMLLELVEKGDQEIIVGAEKHQLERYLQSLAKSA